jgi:hypothetical protein
VEIESLKARVGVEGFFCIVRSTSSVALDPRWYFSSPEIEAYLKLVVRARWDTAEIGARLEAFSIAGCNTLGAPRLCFLYSSVS